MVDLSQFLTVSGLAVLLSVILQFLKQYLPDTAKAFIPWLAVGLGMVLAVVVGVATGQSGAQALTALAVTGLLAGLSSVGLYQGTVKVATATAVHPPYPPIAGGAERPPSTRPWPTGLGWLGGAVVVGVAILTLAGIHIPNAEWWVVLGVGLWMVL